MLRSELVKKIGLDVNDINREIETLFDLGEIKYYEAFGNIALTANGKKHYEEHVLPAHNQVFIIAPCAEKEIIDLFKEILEKHGRKAVVQEENEPRTETIREDMLNNICYSRFIIADITGRGKEEGECFNTNCVYEVDYAHACKKRIVCCVREDVLIKDEKGHKVLPFDIAGIPFTFWNPGNLEEFRQKVADRVDQIENQFMRELWPEK